MALAQQRFSSRLATLATMSGLANGLGTVWRFPYMAGQYGGSAFLLIYCLFMVLLAATFWVRFIVPLSFAAILGGFIYSKLVP